MKRGRAETEKRRMVYELLSMAHHRNRLVYDVNGIRQEGPTTSTRTQQETSTTH